MLKEQEPNLSPPPKEHQGLRLLGNCPNCQGEDTLVASLGSPGTPKWDIALCESCKTTWSDWLRLRCEEKERGNLLIPVEIERQIYGGEEYGVQLYWQRRNEIPQVNLITSVLNAALMTKFKLRVCLATEGGVKGKYKDTFLELRNMDSELGLYVEDADWRQGRGLTEILDFYERMLRVLFTENFRVGKKEYRRGEILRLPPESQTTEKIWEILMAMLVKVGNKKFAKKVVKRIIDNSFNPFSRPHLRGLTPEEIVNFFVPPPLTKDKDI